MSLYETHEFVRIDVAKGTLDVAIYSTSKTCSCPNDPQSFPELIVRLQQSVGDRRL